MGMANVFSLYHVSDTLKIEQNRGKSLPSFGDEMCFVIWPSDIICYGGVCLSVRSCVHLSENSDFHTMTTAIKLKLGI